MRENTLTERAYEQHLLDQRPEIKRAGSKLRKGENDLALQHADLLKQREEESLYLNEKEFGINKQLIKELNGSVDLPEKQLILAD